MLILSRDISLHKDIYKCLSKEEIKNILCDKKNNIICFYNIPISFRFPIWLMITKFINYDRSGGICMIMNKDSNVRIKPPDYLKKKAVLVVNMQCSIVIQTFTEKTEMKWSHLLARYLDSLVLEQKKNIVLLCNDKNNSLVYETHETNLYRKKANYGYLHYSPDLDKYMEYNADDLVFDFKKTCNIKILKKKKRKSVNFGNENNTKMLKSRDEGIRSDEEPRYTVYRDDEQSQQIELNTEDFEGEEEEEDVEGEEDAVEYGV